MHRQRWAELLVKVVTGRTNLKGEEWPPEVVQRPGTRSALAPWGEWGLRVAVYNMHDPAGTCCVWVTGTVLDDSCGSG